MILHTAPPRGWAEHLSYPSGPAHQCALTFTLFMEAARPTALPDSRLRERAGEPVTCLHSLLLQHESQ